MTNGQNSANKVNIISAVKSIPSVPVISLSFLWVQGERRLYIDRIIRSNENRIEIRKKFWIKMLDNSGNSIGFPVEGSTIALKISENLGIRKKPRYKRIPERVIAQIKVKMVLTLGFGVVDSGGLSSGFTN